MLLEEVCEKRVSQAVFPSDAFTLPISDAVTGFRKILLSPVSVEPWVCVCLCICLYIHVYVCVLIHTHTHICAFITLPLLVVFLFHKI